MTVLGRKREFKPRHSGAWDPSLSKTEPPGGSALGRSDREITFLIYLRILSKVGSRIRIHALAADAVGQTSLDNFVGAGEDRLRDGEAERLGGL